MIFNFSFPGTDMDHNKDQLQCSRKYNVLFKTAYGCRDLKMICKMKCILIYFVYFMFGIISHWTFLLLLTQECTDNIHLNNEK